MEQTTLTGKQFLNSISSGLKKMKQHLPTLRTSTTHKLPVKIMLVLVGMISFTGCTSMVKVMQNDSDSNKVIRAVVLSSEDPNAGTGPTKGGWVANMGHVGPECIHYRWVYINETVGSVFNGGVRHRGKILVDSRVPALREGDIIDVAVYPIDDVNYNELKGTTAFRLVCRASDSACKDDEKRRLGSLTGVIVPDVKPDFSQFVFVKVYDEHGRAAVPFSDFAPPR